MTARMTAGLITLMMAALASPVMAERYSPSHTCIQPVKPEQFHNNGEVAMFNDAVREYKRCITKFADEHYGIATSHQGAADQAISEWNRFLNENDLN